MIRTDFLNTLVRTPALLTMCTSVDELERTCQLKPEELATG